MGNTYVPQPAFNGNMVVKNTSGLWASDARQRFYALCELFPDKDVVMELADKLVGWPIKKSEDGDTPKGTMMRPSDTILALWWHQWLEGDEKATDKTNEMMRARVKAFLEMEELQVKRDAIKVVKHYQQKALNNELSVAEQVSMKYAYDGAGFLKTSMREEGPKQTIQVGRLNINAGERPTKKPNALQKKRQRTLLKEGVVIGEYREVE